MSIPPDQSPDRVSPGQPPREPLEKPISPGRPQADFQQHMEGTRTQQGMQQATTGTPTPMDVARGPALSTSGISFDSIMAQSKQAQDSLGTVEDQLKDKNLKLKRSQSHLIRQKLGDANNYIRAAGSKLGLKMSEGKMPPGLSGIARFIAMINDGQDQLAQVQQQLKETFKKGTNINAGEMLSVQVKMGLATQEIEYTSTLLGKVIQGITQLMNTQL